MRFICLFSVFMAVTLSAYAADQQTVFPVSHLYPNDAQAIDTSNQERSRPQTDRRGAQGRRDSSTGQKPARSQDRNRTLWEGDTGQKPRRSDRPGKLWD